MFPKNIVGRETRTAPMRYLIPILIEKNYIPIEHRVIFPKGPSTNSFYCFVK